MASTNSIIIATIPKRINSPFSIIFAPLCDIIDLFIGSILNNQFRTILIDHFLSFVFCPIRVYYNRIFKGNMSGLGRSFL